MPNPAKFKNTEKGYKRFMQLCMHQTLHKEKKERDQAIAQCMAMWRKEHGPKRPGKLPRRKMALRVAEGFLSMQDSGHQNFSSNANLTEDLAKVDTSKKPSVFLGGSCENDEWRDNIKKEFGDNFLFLDPFKPDYDLKTDIYNEMAGLVKADYVIFFQGGEGSKKEKEFLNQLNKPYHTFRDLQDLKKYLSYLSQDGNPLTWNQIQDSYTEKYGENHHHLRLYCLRCGNQLTCRCSASKISEFGICPECSN